MALGASLLLATSARAEPGDRKARHRLPPKLRQKLLERFDADGDGQLDDEEKAAAKEAFKAKLKERFDRNGDGELDARERRALERALRFRKRMRQRHGGGGEGTAPTTPS